MTAPPPSSARIRTAAWSIGGLAAGVTTAVLNWQSPQDLAIYGFIGTVTGLVAGLLANIRAPIFAQALLVGGGGGACLALLNGWIIHAGPPNIPLGVGALAGAFVHRYLTAHYRAQGYVYAPPTGPERSVG